MELKPGTRLRSSACSTEVIVVRAGNGDLDLRCGGVPMTKLEDDAAQHPLDSEHAAGTALGKRYVDDDGVLELLCTKSGAGSLTLDRRALTLKEAKPLPSSD